VLATRTDFGAGNLVKPSSHGFGNHGTPLIVQTRMKLYVVKVLVVSALLSGCASSGHVDQRQAVEGTEAAGAPSSTIQPRPTTSLMRPQVGPTSTAGLPCAEAVPLNVARTFEVAVVARQADRYLPCLQSGRLGQLAVTDPSNVQFLSWLASNHFEAYEGQRPTTVFPEGTEYTFLFGSVDSISSALAAVTVTREADQLYYVSDVAISEPLPEPSSG